MAKVITVKVWIKQNTDESGEVAAIEWITNQLDGTNAPDSVGGLSFSMEEV
jgi:hypothetical protein